MDTSQGRSKVGFLFYKQDKNVYIFEQRRQESKTSPAKRRTRRRRRG